MIKKNGNEIKKIKKTILPNEYQQVEYIQSVNIPKIYLGVTGASLGGTFTVETTFQIYQTVTYSGNVYIMGSGPTSYGRCLNVGVNSSGNMLLVGNEYGGSTARTITITSSDVNIYNKNNYKFVLKENGRNELQVNGNIFKAGGNCSNSGTVSIRLFNGLDNNVTPYLRLFNFKLFDSTGKLLFNLIPCYRKSDNVVGLYNSVNGTFFVNDETGSGSFTAGNKSGNMNNIIKVKKNNELVYGGLPYGYTRLTYIKSTSEGGQWIDTGITGNNDNLKIRVKYAWSTVPATGYYGYVIGSYNSENYNSTRILQYGPSTTYLNLNNRASNSHSYTGTRIADTIYEDILTKTTYTSNGVTIPVTLSTSGTANNLTMYLFHAHKQTSQESGSGKNLMIYYCSIYNGDELIAKFIPCRNSVGILGMYDVVNNKFCENIGTGSFIAGSE